MAVLSNLSEGLLFSPLNLALLVFGGFALYGAGYVIYQIFLHPLAKYPGPFLVKFSDAYLGYYAWTGDRHLEFYRCHAKYGQFVRIGPNLLSVNTNTALKTIYGFRSNVRKGNFYTAFWANKNAFNVHNVIDKQIHARKRRVLSHAFSDSAVKSMEKYILANIENGFQVIKQKSIVRNEKPDLLEVQKVGVNDTIGEWMPALNIGSWCDWLTFDIMGDLAFGKAFGIMDHPQNRFVVDLVSSAAHRHLICGTHLPMHEYHLDKLFFHKIAAKRTQYMQYSKAQAMERTKLGLDVDRKDFFYYLLNAKDPETGHGFSPAELWGESNLLIIAGSDTTSTALAGSFFYLTHNPAALQKAEEEVRSHFSSLESIVQGQALSSCTYLHACIDESMRLSPPVGGGLPRTVLAGGLTVDGHVFPEGIDICVPHYAIHHNAEYYPQPFAFLPERWLPDREGTPAELKSHVDAAHSAFCPFSVGPRGCIGKGLAYVELMITLARTLYAFDMRVQPGTHVGEGNKAFDPMRRRAGEYQLRDTFTATKQGPLVQFRVRDTEQ